MMERSFGVLSSANEEYDAMEESIVENYQRRMKEGIQKIGCIVERRVYERLVENKEELMEFEDGVKLIFG